MPYILDTPKALPVAKEVSVAITRLRIISFFLSVGSPIKSRADVELQSGSGPYAEETTAPFDFDQNSTMLILNTSTAGESKVSGALEKGIFNEMTRLGILPTGSVV